MSPLAVRAALLAALLAMLAGTFWWHGRQEFAAGKAEGRAEVKAEWADDVAIATRKAQAETDQRIETQKEVARVAQLSRDHTDSDARVAVDSATRLLDRARERRCPDRADPPTASASAPAGEADVVPAELLGGVLEVARQLAREADYRRTAGLACEQSYSALTR
jgi:hypothetical protein